MKKFFYIIITLVLSINLYGCASRRNDQALEFDDQKKTEEAEETMSTTNNIGAEESSSINFYLYKSYEVDTSGFRRRFKVVEETPFTMFMQVYNLNTWKNHGCFWDAKFEFPEFDFQSDDYQDKYLVVSFGREVVEMNKIEETYYGYIDAAITFAEEYHGDVMFLYIMDKIPLRNGLGSEFYIMNGTEKVFKGYSDMYLNETDMVPQGPNGAG